MEGIEEFLNTRQNNNLLRSLNSAQSREKGLIYFKGKEYIDFSSNDYLGLSSHSRLKDFSKECLQKLGTGSCASRLLSGSLDIHQELEEKIAKFKNKPSGLIFNSGYQANVGIISAFCEKGDVVFLDKLSHASIIDGVKLSGAKFFRFKHNDTQHLKSLLEKHRGDFRRALVITESVFSMDGDIAPLEEFVQLKNNYDFQIMVDEAHATGIFGENGSGLVQKKGLSAQIDIIMGTFGKALGSFGAYTVFSEKLKNYFINKSRSFIYSTSLPPSVIAANLASLEIVKNEPYRRKELLERSDYLRTCLKNEGFLTKGESQIIPLIVKDPQKSLDISNILKEKGYWVQAIRPPTVPLGQSRLRFSLNYDHSKSMLEELMKSLCRIKGVLDA